MNEGALIDVLLARALEASDREQRIVPDSLRRRAAEFAQSELGRRTSGEHALREAFLARRAAALLDVIGKEYPKVAAIRGAARAAPASLAVLPIVAFAAGLIADLLGSGQYVNLLAAPILAALAWNLLVYLSLAVRTTMKPASAKASALRSLLARWMLRHRKRANSSAGDDLIVSAAARSFSSELWEATWPLHLARAAAALHLAAALFAVGAIAGMYARGLGFEYRAGWESTFLTPDSVQAILEVVLAPGVALLGREIPGPAHLAELRFAAGTGGENAAPWIHLFAATALCVIVAPRLVLAFASFARAVRLRRALAAPIEADDLRRLLPSTLAPEAAIEVIPYSYHLDPIAEARIRAHLEWRFGPAAKIRIATPLAFGADAAEMAPAQGAPPGEQALLFNLAATPEAEVHGRIIDSLRPQPRVLVDEAPYRARLAGDASFERQLEARRESWRTLCAARQIEPDFVSA
jgi:hypothetical protein